MALKLITAALKAGIKGGAAGGLAAAAGKAISGLEGDKDSAAIKDTTKKAEGAQEKKMPSPISTGTPKALAGFAALVEKESIIAARIADKQSGEETPSSIEPPSPNASFFEKLGTAAAELKRMTLEELKLQEKRALEFKRQQDEEKVESLGDVFKEGMAPIKRGYENTKDTIADVLKAFKLPALLLGGGYIAQKINSLLPERFRANSVEDVIGGVEYAAEKISQVAGVAGITSVANRIGRATKTSLAAAGIIKPPAQVVAPAGQAARMAVGRVMPGAGKYQKFLSKIQGAMAWFSKLQQSTSGIVAKASQWLARLPAKVGAFLKRTAGKVLKWFLIFEILTAIYNATQAVMLGTITAEEWHKRNKEQITKLVRLFGGPLIVTMLLGVAGTVVPVLGNIAGGTAGFIIGIILGEKVFDILKLDMLVQGFYEVIFEGKWGKLIAFVPSLIKSVAYELPKMLAKFAFDAYVGAGKAIIDIGKNLVADRIATDEEIKSKYGDDISTAELLRKAGEGMGTDENAILYAFKDVDTPEKYLELKKQFEENFLPDINEKRTQRGQYFSMEQYLKDELSQREYQQLQQQVTQQMKQNAANDSAALNKFLEDVGYQEPSVEEVRSIPGIDNITEEQLDQYNRGELVDVVVDGKKVLMTLEELRKANIDRKFKRIARDQARMRKLQYEQRQAQSEETPIDESADEGIATTQGQGNNTIPGIGAVTAEEFLRWQQGELLDVLTKDGQKVLMTRRELQDATRAGKVTGAFKRSAIRKADTRRRQYQSGSVPEETRQVRTEGQQPAQRPSEPTPNIIPVVDNVAGNLAVVNQTINQQQRESTPAFGSMPRSQPSSALPTHNTTDSFIEPGFVT